MNKSVIKLKGEDLYISLVNVDAEYILFPTPTLYEDDEVRYILHDIEDIEDTKKRKGIEIIRTKISTSKKREFAKFEDLEIRQVNITLL
jgi:hypothetical protein